MRVPALLAALALTAPATAGAATPPQVSRSAVSQVTETTATLQGAVDPTGGLVKAHFDYTTRAGFEAQGFEGATSAPAEAIAVPSKVQGKGATTAGSVTITGVSASAGTFGVGQLLALSAQIPAATTIKAVAEDPETGTVTLTISNGATATSPQASLTATGPQPVSTPVSGLSPGTSYLFRLVAEKGTEVVNGPATPFYTFDPPPAFGACPNDALRSGTLAPAGQPGALLPDCRSFELATPLAKNGNNALSSTPFAIAAVDGSAITFGSAFGIPGGVGAQNLPYYQSARGAAGWSTTGLLPPATLGAEARALIGSLPDLSATYAFVRRPGPPKTDALFELHRDGTPPTQITPFTPLTANTNYAFAGASADASTVVLEAPTALSEEEGGPAIEGSAAGLPNVYAWQRSTGQLHLASVMNTEAQTEELLAKGAYAGPYNWVFGRLAEPPEHFLLTDEHVVSQSGAVVFTARSSGHVYQRINPTQPQSAMSGNRCTEPDKACTLDVSGSERAEPDPVGERPAAFQAATPDGSSVLFTSSQKLTDDATTGPEQKPARIATAKLNGEAKASEENEELVPTTHALGIAVDPKGTFIYWADPSLGTIGRAKLTEGGKGVEHIEARFVEPPPSENECEVEVKDDVFKAVTIPSAPRYVAVDEGHLYWTNSGLEDVLGPVTGGGTIGRAELKDDGSGIEGEPEPAFICGENPSQPGERLVSNPQGIAVNASHIYWANAALGQAVHRTIARAAIDGKGADENFFQTQGNTLPYGVALDATHLYYDQDGSLEPFFGYVTRITLAGEGEETAFVGKPGLRGIAVDSGHLYWTTQGEGGAIGRISLSQFENCGGNPSCEKQFLTPEGTPFGLAASGGRLYWSTNGESPPNPGNDLYRYEPASGTLTLTDLAPDSADVNGIEVQGVLGTSADGADVYFAANGVPAGVTGSPNSNGEEAQVGNCKGLVKEASGECSLYLAHEGQLAFVARLNAGTVKNGSSFPGGRSSDARNWLGTPQAYESSIYFQKTSLVSSDGQSLAFYSHRRLTAYDNEGFPELYRYRTGEGVNCLTCNPTGEAPRATAEGYFASGAAPSYFDTLEFSGLAPNGEGAGPVQVRFMSEDGNRVFFETPESLTSTDADGGSCHPLGTQALPSCLDVYEWEAPGAGSCEAGGPAYSPQNEGCLYLISPQSPTDPAYFVGASASGEDAFFFTTSQLVGEDTDELQDVYDARVEGGLASQNPSATPSCEAEGCRPAATPPPAYQAPPQFSGPPNPKPKRCHGKRCHHKKKHKHKRHHHKKQGGHRAAHRRSSER
jgi:hypothetical protein